jgi:transcription antitermination factor NusG
LNSQNQNPASDTAPNSTKTKNIFSTDTQVLKTVDVTAENIPMPQSVELEAQTLTQQPIPNSTSNSTKFNKPRSVKSKALKIGDRVRIKTGNLGGLIATVESVDDTTATLTRDSWAVKPSLPITDLERVK